MNMALAGLVLLVIGDSHMVSQGYLISSLHESLVSQQAIVHSYGACGVNAGDWVYGTSGTCGQAERHERGAPRIDYSSRAKGWTVKELIERHRPDPEPTDRHVWTVESKGRDHCVKAGAVGEAGPGPRGGSFNPTDGEPMLNLLCTPTRQGWRLILFPRLKHRPEAYDRQGNEKLLVSPGAADMGGIFITPMEKDFLALDRELIRGIFHEVALDDAAVKSLLDAL